MAKVLKRLFMVLFGAVLALLAGEGVARLIVPKPTDLYSPMAMAKGDLDQFEFSDDLGFFPKVGEGERYGLYGCLPNSYEAQDRKGRTRVLFAGDSVTHRAKIVDALKEVYGDKDYEYWNAGVESFNTFQETELYKRHNRELKPDIVVLTFHNNDFLATPVAVQKDGQITLFQPNHPNYRHSASLLKKSALSRLLLKLLVSRSAEDTKEQVRRSLSDLKKAVESDGGTLRVVLFPILLPEGEWKEHQIQSRASALEIFKELGLEYYDLLPSLESALKEKVELHESPGDDWHPSAQAGLHFARFLKAENLLLPADQKR